MQGISQSAFRQSCRYCGSADAGYPGAWQRSKNEYPLHHRRELALAHGQDAGQIRAQKAEKAHKNIFQKTKQITVPDNDIVIRHDRSSAGISQEITLTGGGMFLLDRSEIPARKEK